MHLVHRSVGALRAFLSLNKKSNRNANTILPVCRQLKWINQKEGLIGPESNSSTSRHEATFDWFLQVGNVTKINLFPQEVIRRKCVITSNEQDR